jgi:uncharacterized membrane protein YgcG
MTTYVEVAQALVAAGYVSDADVDAAASVLGDALVVESAQDAMAEALADEAYQEGLIADAEAMANVDVEMGTYEDEEMDMETVEDAQARVDVDEGVIANAQNWMTAAYRDAAAALLAAELIDEANADAVAAVIADVWVV